MQRLEVSGAVRLIYKSLGVKGLTDPSCSLHVSLRFCAVSPNHFTKPTYYHQKATL